MPAPLPHPATILVVDDDPPIVDVFTDVLEFAGYRVLQARDGADAYRRVLLDHPDLLLTDNVMPGLSGVDLARRLQADGPTLPIILTSASKVSAVLPGVTILPKPFDVKDLTAAVARLLTLHNPPATT